MVVWMGLLFLESTTRAREDVGKKGEGGDGQIRVGLLKVTFQKISWRRSGLTIVKVESVKVHALH